MFTSFEMMKICFQRQDKSHQEMMLLLKTLERRNSESTASKQLQTSSRSPKNLSFEGSINLVTEICVVIDRSKKKIR